jgi:hypothetical protein
MRSAAFALLACLGLAALPLDPAAQPLDFDTLGAQALRTGYPLLAMAAWRDSFLKAGGSLNRFTHRREMLSAFADETFPNSDTLSSTAWVELAEGPVTLRVPATGGRYITIQFVSAWTDSFLILSRKDLDGHAAMLYLTQPGWSGAVPPGYRQVPCPTSMVAVWLRLFVAGEGDVPSVRVLQQQFSFSGTPSPRQTPKAFLEALGALLPPNPPPAPLRAAFERFEPLGLSLRSGFEPCILSPESRRSVDAAIELARKDLPPRPTRKPRRLDGGWALYDAGPAIPATLQERIFRARSGPSAFAALPATELVYAVGYADADGELLQGNRRYVVTFDPGSMPPSDGFWSFSVYTASGRTVFGARHSLHSFSPYLNKTSGGSIRITLGPSVPLAEQSNWLPLQPGEGVRLVLRLYQPRRPALDGSWRLPAIAPIQQAAQ